MSYGNLIELYRLILYLSNLTFSCIDLISFSQFWVMPSSSNYLSKRRQGGRKASASGRRSYKRKCNENSSQNKYQNPTTSLLSRDLPRSDPDLSGVIEVPGEESPKDKLTSLHKQWKRKDYFDSSKSNQLVTKQWQWCKDVRMAVFKFELQESQVEAVSTLFYKRRDLLLLAKTGFGKSLIFQILPFMFKLVFFFFYIFRCGKYVRKIIWRS